MKNVLFLFSLLILSFFVFTGCTQNDGNKQSSQSKQSTVKDQAENNNHEVTEPKRLTKSGQSNTDLQSGAKVELLSITDPDKIIDLNPIKLTINRIKILNLSDFKNLSFTEYPDSVPNNESVNIIQIEYAYENTVDKSIRLNIPIKAIVLESGEQIYVFESRVINDPVFAKDLYGKVKGNSFLQVFIKDTNPNDIKKMRLVTGRIDDNDTSDTLVKPQMVNIDIKQD